MNKQPQAREKTRANLVEAFWRLYGKSTLKKITVKTVTDLAGYNHCTFYDYFTDIYDLLNYAEDKLIDELIDYLRIQIRRWNSQDVLVNAAIAYEHYGYYLSILLGPKGDPAFAQKYKKALLPLLFQEFNLPRDDPRAGIICQFSLGGVISSLTYWHDNKSVSAEQLASFLYAMLDKGIMTVLKSKSF
jgi:AcrR family transcriptional regulator